MFVVWWERMIYELIGKIICWICVSLLTLIIIGLLMVWLYDIYLDYKNEIEKYKQNNEVKREWN